MSGDQRTARRHHGHARTRRREREGEFRRRTEAGRDRLLRRPGDRAGVHLAGVLAGRRDRTDRAPRRGLRPRGAARQLRADAADRVGVLLPQLRRPGLRHDVLLGHPGDGAVVRVVRRLGDRDDRRSRHRLARRGGRLLLDVRPRSRLGRRDRLARASPHRAAHLGDDGGVRVGHRGVGQAPERADRGPGAGARRLCRRRTGTGGERLLEPRLDHALAELAQPVRARAAQRSPAVSCWGCSPTGGGSRRST